MGRVLEAEQIRARQVPEDGAHAKAGQAALAQIPEALYGYGLDEIVQAMVYGSTALGRADICSDVDFNCFYPNYETRAILVVVPPLLRAIGQEFKVHFEASFHSFEEIAQGYHHLDYLFVEHLKYIDSLGGWSIGNPSDFLKQYITEPSTPEAKREVVKEYVIRKRKSFAEAGSNSEVSYNRLQRALELPKAIGRKVIHLDQKTSENGVITPPNNEVVQQLEIILGPKLSGIIKSLATMNAYYSQLLADTLKQESDISYYEEWINASYQLVITWAMDACSDVLEWLESQAR